MPLDPGTGLTVLGAALGSKDLILKILGPTADYLGSGLQGWTDRGVKNLGRVFDNAKRMLGNKIDTPGAVPPQVLKGILEGGPFCDDELAAEYFGGVLASSRSEVGRDDRGAAFLALIGRLSAYQIRSHFFFYTMVRTLYEGLSENLGVPEGRRRLKTFVPLQAYALAMEFGPKENFATILSHVMFGLSREALIESEFFFGNIEDIKSHYQEADLPGLVFSPSVLGVEFFMWAHGRGDLDVRGILNPATQLDSNVRITTAPGIRSTIFPERTFPKTVGAKPSVPSA